MNAPILVILSKSDLMLYNFWVQICSYILYDIMWSYPYHLSNSKTLYCVFLRSVFVVFWPSVIVDLYHFFHVSGNCEFDIWPNVINFNRVRIRAIDYHITKTASKSMYLFACNSDHWQIDRHTHTHTHLHTHKHTNCSQVVKICI